jgi:hypothetical protein
MPLLLLAFAAVALVAVPAGELQGPRIRQRVADADLPRLSMEANLA